MRTVYITLCLFALTFISCGKTPKEASWQYVGSYYCNYDVFQPSFYQTQTAVQVYYKPGNGNVVYYGVKDDSGNIMEQWAGPSSLNGFGTVNFNNFRQGNNIGIVALRIRDLPMQYWPAD